MPPALLAITLPKLDPGETCTPTHDPVGTVVVDVLVDVGGIVMVVVVLGRVVVVVLDVGWHFHAGWQLDALFVEPEKLAAALIAVKLNKTTKNTIIRRIPLHRPNQDGISTVIQST